MTGKISLLLLGLVALYGSVSARRPYDKNFNRAPEEFWGQFTILATYEGNHPGERDGFTGSVVGSTSRGRLGTIIKVTTEGLTPNTVYPAHLHEQACENGDAGGHYKFDDLGAGVPPNEMWPAVSVNPDMKGYGIAESNMMVEDIYMRSVVIHDPDNGNEKMACANLMMPESCECRKGTFSLVNPADATNFPDFEGSATVSQSLNGVEATVEVSGLSQASNKKYPAHLHTASCDPTDAHYKNFASGPATPPNELWPAVVSQLTGEGVGYDKQAFMVSDLKMRSIVIHDPDNSNARLACAPLTRRTRCR